jgi:hypothetical protein
MKTFYISSKQSPKQKVISNSIAVTLQNSGHKISSVVIDEKDIATSFNLEKNYKRNINTIKKSDFIICEISNMSSGLFFWIAAALNEKKPVLALNNNLLNSKQEKSLLTYSAKNKLLAYKEYSEENLNTVINDYLGEVKKIIDTKFILIISPQIDQYLEWASENRRMHKAQVVRRAVEDVMSEDKEYKKYQHKEKLSSKKL